MCDFCLSVKFSFLFYFFWNCKIRFRSLVYVANLCLSTLSPSTCVVLSLFFPYFPAQELWHLPSISSTSQVFSAFHASHQTNTEALSVVSDPAGGSGWRLRCIKQTITCLIVDKFDSFITRTSWWLTTSMPRITTFINICFRRFGWLVWGGGLSGDHYLYSFY